MKVLGFMFRREYLVLLLVLVAAGLLVKVCEYSSMLSRGRKSGAAVVRWGGGARVWTWTWVRTWERYPRLRLRVRYDLTHMAQG